MACRAHRCDQAICALANQDTGLLTGVAGRQVAPAQVEAIAVALDDTAQPLVRALQSAEPTLFEAAPRSAGGDALSAPVFGRARYWALPLGTLGAGQPAGGLLPGRLEWPA